MASKICLMCGLDRFFFGMEAEMFVCAQKVPKNEEKRCQQSHDPSISPPPCLSGASHQKCPRKRSLLWGHKHTHTHAHIHTWAAVLTWLCFSVKSQVPRLPAGGAVWPSAWEKVRSMWKQSLMLSLSSAAMQRHHQVVIMQLLPRPPLIFIKFLTKRIPDEKLHRACTLYTMLTLSLTPVKHQNTANQNMQWHHDVMLGMKS